MNELLAVVRESVCISVPGEFPTQFEMMIVDWRPKGLQAVEVGNTGAMDFPVALSKTVDEICTPEMIIDK
jgi:hypothetical protein